MFHRIQVSIQLLINVQLCIKQQGYWILIYLVYMQINLKIYSLNENVLRSTYLHSCFYAKMTELL